MKMLDSQLYLLLEASLQDLEDRHQHDCKGEQQLKTQSQLDSHCEACV